MVHHSSGMSKVEQIEAELQKLSAAELKRIRDFVDDIVEDNLTFKEEFEADIRQSEKEMAAGKQPRIRKP
jgi:hypothetical protein